MKTPSVKISDYISAEDYEKLISSEESFNNLPLTHIVNVFEELKNSKFEILKTQSFINDARILVKGAVTRIGAYSNIGKSKLTYWLIVELLKNNYAGAVFSTEVNRHTVLANLVSCIDYADFWDVINKRYKPSEKSVNLTDQLQIYDSKHGSMFLKTIREYLIANGGALDFIVTDFCQNIKDYQFSRNEYEQMTNYALEIQQLAQNYNVCVIDLSQLSNASIKEDFKKSGFISFKGSGGLYASADIGIQLTRDKVDAPDILFVEVRKHKFYKTGDLALRVDFARNQFDYISDVQSLETKDRVFLEL